MVRGRLVAVNGAALDVDSYAKQDRRLAEREFNLSYAAELPGHNQIAAGHWFTREELAGGALSVEEGIARRLGWRIGDRLTWQVAGENFTAPIVNIRKLDWDSMQINFFVIATPALLASAPASYVTSFTFLLRSLRSLIRCRQHFSNLTVIDMSAILRQAQTIVDRVVRAVQFVFAFALGAGLLVLYSALLATQDERQHEAALMRALGASRSQILAAQRAEFASLGLISGVPLLPERQESVGLYEHRFPFSLSSNGWVWAAGPLAGLVCVSLNAWAGARSALNHPPLLALREI